MSLSLEAIAAISRTVALEHGRALTVVGVTATEGGSDRSEILITLDGCHDDPCRLLLNVDRTDGREFEASLRAQLIEALKKHVDSPNQAQPLT